jgi:hypothetical protein
LEQNMMKLIPILFLSLLIGATATAVAAPPASVALDSFGDDEQAEQLALNNEDFSSTGPAGGRVTMAVSQALTAAGITVVATEQAEAILHGTVTAAWVNPGMLPTNSVSAHYRLVDKASGAVLAEGNASGTGFNDQDAATALGKYIARKIGR